MVKSGQQITPSSSRGISFDKLALSHSNVRRFKVGLSLEELAEDDALTENMKRVALHPLHQFRAFDALNEKDPGEEDMAAASFMEPQIVKQRLKLQRTPSCRASIARLKRNTLIKTNTRGDRHGALQTMGSDGSLRAAPADL